MRSTVTVLTPAVDPTLVSLATAKTVLGIRSGDQSKNERVRLAIRHASGDCVVYCRRPLRAERISQIFEFDCQDYAVDRLVLDRKPVVTVESVTEGDNPALTVGTDYAVDVINGMIQRLSSSGYATGFHSGKVVVVSTGGFASFEAVDPAVERVCLQLVVAYYNGISRDPSVRSVDVPDVESVTYADQVLTEVIDMQALNPFRKVL